MVAVTCFPAHASIWENERANKLAKKALTKTKYKYLNMKVWKIQCHKEIERETIQMSFTSLSPS